MFIQHSLDIHFLLACNIYAYVIIAPKRNFHVNGYCAIYRWFIHWQFQTFLRGFGWSRFCLVNFSKTESKQLQYILWLTFDARLHCVYNSRTINFCWVLYCVVGKQSSSSLSNHFFQGKNATVSARTTWISRISSMHHLIAISFEVSLLNIHIHIIPKLQSHSYWCNGYHLMISFYDFE